MVALLPAASSATIFARCYLCAVLPVRKPARRARELVGISVVGQGLRRAVDLEPYARRRKLGGPVAYTALGNRLAKLRAYAGAICRTAEGPREKGCSASAITRTFGSDWFPKEDGGREAHHSREPR